MHIIEKREVEIIQLKLENFNDTVLYEKYLIILDYHVVNIHHFFDSTFKYQYACKQEFKSIQNKENVNDCKYLIFHQT